MTKLDYEKSIQDLRDFGITEEMQCKVEDLLMYGLWLRDKDVCDGEIYIHRFGENCHDGLVVLGNGEVHYHNLQNGDGCSLDSNSDNSKSGYELVTINNLTPQEYMYLYKKHFVEREESK